MVRLAKLKLAPPLADPKPNRNIRRVNELPKDLGYAPAVRHPAAPPTPLWIQVLIMAAITLPAIAICQFIAYWRTDVVDDQMFGYFGWRIANGATVYLDVWDNKPPGIYWINALAMWIGGGSYLGVIGVCVVAQLVAMVCFYFIGASIWFRDAAALATILFCFYVTHGYYTGGTNRTETFLVAFELAAVLLYVRGFANDRWWKFLLAGACCGCAFTFKQVGLAAFGAMGLHLIALTLTRELAWREGVRRGLLLLAGVLAVVAIVVGVLAAQGALDAALFATFGFNRAYFDSGDSRFPYRLVTWMLLKNHILPILTLPLLMALAAVVHAVLWRTRPKYRPVEIEKPLAALQPACPRTMLLFTVWTLAAIYGALMSPHAFRHYLVPAIPPLLLMCGYLLNVLNAEVSLLHRMQQRAWTAMAFVLIGYFAIDAFKQQLQEVSKVLVFRFDQKEPAEWEAVAEAVKRVTGPEDRIQCWGYLPGVYLHAKRINSNRFTTTEKVGQVGAGADFVLKELVASLENHPPAVFVISTDDYLWMTGRDPTKPPSQVKLGPWIDANYELVADVARFRMYVFKRKDLVTPQDRAETLIAFPEGK